MSREQVQLEQSEERARPKAQAVGLDETARDLSLTEVIAASKRRSSLLIGCALLGSLCALALALLSRPVYKASAKVLLEEPTGLPSALSSLGGIPGLSSLAGGSSVIAAEVERIRSRTLLRRVLAGPDATVLDDQELVPLVLDANVASLWLSLKGKLGLGTDASTDASKGALRGTEAGQGEELTVDVTRWDFPIEFDGLLEVHFLSPSRVRIGFSRLFDKQQVEEDFRPGEQFDYQQASLSLWPRGDLTGRTFLVGAKTLRLTVDDLLENLVIEEKTRGSNVLGLTYFGPSPRQSADLVNRLVDEFVRSRKDLSSTESGRTIEYIQGELERIGRDLAEAEQQGVEWSEGVGSMALPESAQVLVQNLSEIELEQTRSTFAADSLEGLLASVEAGELTEDELLAMQAALDSSDPSGADLEPLALLVAKRESLRAIYNDEWPELRTTLAEIDARLDGISQTLRGQIELERRTASDLARISQGYEQELAMLPETQLAFARHKRSIQTLGGIEVFFRSQLEDARLRLAATTPNAEVLDWAVEPLLRDRPSLRLNLSIGLLVGLVLGLALGLLLELKRPVVSVERMAEVSGAPVLGTLRRRRWQPLLALRDRPSSRAAGDVRALRLALLQRTQAGCPSIAIADSGRHGRSSPVAANLAFALVAKGERVLLVDGEPRRYALAKRLGWHVAPSEAVGLGDEELVEAARSGGVDDLDLLALGGEVALADQADAGKAQEFLSRARGSWERVMIDTGVVGEAADALALCRSVDGVVLVARSGHTAEADVIRAASLLERVGANLLGVVLSG